MAVIKQYIMQAATGRESGLSQALGELATLIRGRAGCERIEVLRRADDPASFVFMEYWVSAEMQKAAGQQLGKDAFKNVMSMLGSPPSSQTLETVATL